MDGLSPRAREALAAHRARVQPHDDDASRNWTMLQHRIARGEVVDPGARPRRELRVAAAVGVLAAAAVLLGAAVSLRSGATQRVESGTDGYEAAARSQHHPAEGSAVARRAPPHGGGSSSGQPRGGSERLDGAAAGAVAPEELDDAAHDAPLAEGLDGSASGGSVSEGLGGAAETTASRPGARRPRARSKPQEPVSSPTTRFDREAELIGAARASLRGGDTSAALRYLRDHERGFGHGALVAEREVLWITTLCRTGQAKRAQARARRFRTRHPGSALLEHVNRSCAASH